MKASTMLFAEKRCAENRARMKRESRGDFGQPVHIVLDESRSTHRLVDGKLVEKE